MKRLVVVTPSSLIVKAIATGLRPGTEFGLLRQVSGPMTSVKTIVEPDPDIVLLDYMSQSDQAVLTVAQIRALAPQIAIIVLTISMEPAWLDLIFDAGAAAAISKETPPTALATLVRETINGHVVGIYRGAPSARADRPAAAAEAESSLTARELEILRHVASGETNGQIAAKLWVTEQTVKFHLSNVYRKLDVGNRTAASYYAHVHGLVASPEAATASR
jgi:DNA-binding NarL/FixJ family response regulator